MAYTISQQIVRHLIADLLHCLEHAAKEEAQPCTEKGHFRCVLHKYGSLYTYVVLHRPAGWGLAIFKQATNVRTCTAHSRQVRGQRCFPADQRVQPGSDQVENRAHTRVLSTDSRS